MVTGNDTTVVLLTLGNVYENVKIFDIIESRKLRGNVDDRFGFSPVEYSR